MVRFEGAARKKKKKNREGRGGEKKGGKRKKRKKKMFRRKLDSRWTPSSPLSIPALTFSPGSRRMASATIKILTRLTPSVFVPPLPACFPSPRVSPPLVSLLKFTPSFPLVSFSFFNSIILFEDRFSISPFNYKEKRGEKAVSSKNLREISVRVDFEDWLKVQWMFK